MKGLDLNCDLGEGADNDAALMPLISSCSIACGGHYGNTTSMNSALILAKKYRVNVGAHPSYPDTINFGRKSIQLSAKAFQIAIRNQLEAFQREVRQMELPWHHVKPHGALYNDMASDTALAEQFLEVVSDFPQVNKIYGLAGKPVSKIIEKKGFEFVAEGFADRAYDSCGNLTPRTQPGSVFDQVAQVRDQVQLFQSGYVRTFEGSKLPLTVSSICVHSDSPNALVFLKYLSPLLLHL